MTCGEICTRFGESKELRWRLLILFAFACGSLMISAGQATNTAGKEVIWQVLFWYSAFLVCTAQMSDTVKEFFLGEGPSVTDHMKYLFAGKAIGNKAYKSDMSTGELAENRLNVGFWTLMPSAFITWIFAKSINNSANLGGKFGVMGGIAYAGWYTSFWSAAYVGYRMRTKHGLNSLPKGIEKCFGGGGNIGFSFALFFRLWNEVWSNIIVVASFYGPSYSSPWWYAATVSAAVPAAYVMMGGMRASLVSDMLQAFLGLIFLFVLLGIIGHQMGNYHAGYPDMSNMSAINTTINTAPPNDVWSWTPPGGYLTGGGTCLIAALLQGLASYPFHDPVLTDRSFLSTPRTMVSAFMIGGTFAMMFIILFSGVGIYATFINNAVTGSSTPTIVASHLGGAGEVIMTLVMMTSSLSTLDSTFTSTAKLVALEMFGWIRLPGDKRAPGVRGTLTGKDPSVTGTHITIGRLSIIVICLLGAVFLEAGRETDALKATTVSGTMVMGLGPPVYLACFWKYNSSPGANDGWRKSPLAFQFSFIPGLFFGFAYSAGTWAQPNVGLAAALEAASMGDGPYRKFFGWNVIGHLVCFAGCVLGFAIHQFGKIGKTVDAEPTMEDPKTGARIVRPGYEAAAAAEAETAKGPSASSTSSA